MVLFRQQILTHIVDKPRVCEAQMIRRTRKKMNFVRLIELFQSNKIFLIQLCLAHLEPFRVAARRKEAEPLTIAREHHRVLGELDHDKRLELEQVLFVFRVFLRAFVVDVGQKRTVFQVGCQV